MGVFALACTPTTDPPAPTATPSPQSPTATPASTPVSGPDPGCAEVIDFGSQLELHPASAGDLATARAVLATELTDYSVSLDQQHVRSLRRALADPIPALAHLLTDDELGDSAASAMFAVDRNRAAPLVFGSMPGSDRNVQFHSFTAFLRWSFDGSAPCWDAVVRDAAVRTLQAGTNADAAEAALHALGLTGKLADDEALLRRYSTLAHDVPMWQDRVNGAARAALARLGDGVAIAALKRELDIPIPETVDFDTAMRLGNALHRAGFAHQRSLLPLLCRHLDTPGAAPDGDMIPIQPPREAARAIGHLLDDTPLDASVEVVAARARCRLELSPGR
jgi:hypothetical protein